MEETILKILTIGIDQVVNFLPAPSFELLLKVAVGAGAILAAEKLLNVSNNQRTKRHP